MNAILNKSLEHGNNKPFWKYIKARRNDNIGVAAIKNDGILYHDSKTKAKLLSHQLKSVFTMDDDTDRLPTMSHPKYPNIENITISIERVEKLLITSTYIKQVDQTKYQILSLRPVLRKFLQHWLTFFNNVLILVPYQMNGEMQI